MFSAVGIPSLQAGEDVKAHLIRHSVVPGEIKSRYGADGQGASLYLSDPEGNTVELKGPPESRLVA